MPYSKIPLPQLRSGRYCEDEHEEQKSVEMRDSASESSYEPSDSEEIERPNRWTGPPSTWQSLTAQERGLAASLIELRNRDLSLHLYNAFALKRRARKYRELKRADAALSRSGENPEDREGSEGADDVEDVEGNGWSPPKVWTAWPLPPDLVPRTDEHVGPEDEDEAFTFKRRERERPSRELEDVLVGSALKIAKEKWEARDWAESWEGVDDVDNNDEGLESGMKARTEEAHDPPHEEEPNGPIIGGANEDSIIKEPSQPPPETTIMRAVLSADDQRSRDLLRPSIRHTLTKLDAVLMALHHARKICHHYGSGSEANTDDDDRTPSVAPDSLTPTKRSRGRPRKFENLASRPKSSAVQTSEDVDVELWRPKTSNRGRPRKKYERLDGETQEEYLIRVARIQKKPLPVFAPPRVTETPELPPERQRRVPSRGRRLGVRDWSEVLGSAALVGFPPDVIARATQRCADMFGEGMTMLKLLETPPESTEADLLTIYQPEEISDLRDESEETSDSGDGEERFNRRHAIRKPKKYRPGLYACLCPIEGCPRQARGFNHISNLMGHLRKAHDLKEGDIDDLLDNDEEMHGAVHVDGFLKPMRNPRGVRGVDKGSRKKGRWIKNNAEEDEKTEIVESEEGGRDQDISSEST